MGFDIRLRTRGPREARGFIRLGQSEEPFQSSLARWSADEYERQWLAAVRRILGRARSACLVTDVPPRGMRGELGQRWLLFKRGEDVAVYCQYFRPARAAAAAPPRRPPKAAPGERIARWSVSVAALRAWADARP